MCLAALLLRIPFLHIKHCQSSQVIPAVPSPSVTLQPEACSLQAKAEPTRATVEVHHTPNLLHSELNADELMLTE